MRQYREVQMKVKDVFQSDTQWKPSGTNNEDINNLRRQNQDLQRKLQEMVDMNRKLSQYENRIAIMSQEIERLRQDLRNKI